MKKLFFRQLTFLALILMFSQILYPFGNAMASSSMLPPSNLTSEYVTPDDIKLTWSSVAGATGYNIYEITDGQLILLDTTITNSYTSSNLAEGTYRYVVSTLSSEGESGPSAPVTVDIVYPEMESPATLTSKVTYGNDITFTWTGAFYAENYNVYQISEDGQKTLINSSKSTTYKITNSPEGSFTYAVAAVNSLYGESDLSDTVKVEIVYPTMNVPGNFTYSVSNGNDVTFKWDSVINATGYNLYQIIEGERVLKQTVSGSPYKLTNVPAGEYTYEIRSKSERFGESNEGNQVTVSVGEVTMAPPSNFIYSLMNINDVYLKWDSAQYANSYNIYRIINGEKVLKDKNVTALNIQYLKAEPGEHTYVIHSYSTRFGESAEGSQVSLIVDEVIMEAPGGFTHQIQNGNDIELTWDSAANSTSYKVYQVINGQKTLKVTVSGNTHTFTNMPEGEYIYEIHSNSNRFGESEKAAQVTFSLIHPVLEPPANVKETINNETDFNLSWDAVDYAASYKIYQVIDGKKVLKNTTSKNNFSYVGMASGEYSFIIHSYSSRFGESAEGAKVSFTLQGKTMLPPVTFNKNITNGNDVKLSWTAAENADGYKLYEVINGEKIFKKTITGTSISYLNLAAGDYYYVIHSNSALFGESKEGTELKFQLVHPVMYPPETITSSVKNGNDLVLAWEQAEFAESYKIYELVGNEKILKYTVTTLNKTISKVPAGEHTYIVHSVSSRFGESPGGKKLTITMSEYIMDPPEISTQTVTNFNNLTLEWKAAAYATKYKIYEIISGEKVWIKDITETTTNLNNLSQGEHLYHVHSVSDRFGESPEGSKVSVEIVFPVLQAPDTLSHEIQQGNNIVLNWSAATYASGYKLYKLVDNQKVLLETVYGQSTTTTTLVNVTEGKNSYIIHSYSSKFGESIEGKQLEVTVVYPTMKAPEDVTKSFINGNDLVLQWKKANYANNYKVYQIINDERVFKGTVNGTTITYENIVEGKHQYEIHSYSKIFGESPEGSLVSFDMIYPTMQAPENITHTIVNGNDVTLKWDISEYATKYKIYQIMDGEKELIKTQSGRTFSYTNMPEGDYQFVVHSFSDRFGESPIGTEYTFEIVHPIMEKPENFYETITNGNDIKLRWASAEYATSYKLYRIVNEQKELIKTLTGLSVSYTNMPEGDYQYVVHSYSDRFGESPEGSLVNFELIWPEVATPQLKGTINNINNITLSWPAASWAEGYRIYQTTDGNKKLVYQGTSLKTEVNNLTENTHKFEAVAYHSRFGESKTSNQITETIVYPEMQPPTASLNLLDETSAKITWNFITYAGSYNIYELIDGKPVLIAQNVNNLSYTIKGFSYANHNYYVTSYSNSFGESEPSNIVLAKLIIDDEAPVTTSDAITDWTNQTTTVNLSATDNETGVKATFYSLDGNHYEEGTSFTLDAEGVHTIFFYSVDHVGNEEEANTVEVKIDKTAPETSANLIDQWHTADVKVQLTATDNLSGVAKTFYSVDGLEYVEGTSFTVADDKKHVVSYYSVDYAGNKEEVKTQEVKIDSETPVTTSDIVDKWNQTSVEVKLTATDNLSGVAKTFYSVDGSEYVEGTSFTVTEDKKHVISYYSVDYAGNKEEVKSQEVKIDNEAPVTTSDIVDKWNQTSVEVNLTSTDNLSGVAKTFYSVDGSEYVEGTSFTVTDDKKHVVSYYSVDNAGNEEEVKTQEVKIDSETPVTTSDIVDKWNQKSVVVNLTSTDNLSGVEKTFYSVNGSEYVEGTSFTVTEDKKHVVSYYSVDNAGNEEEVKIQEVKIDSEAPKTTDNVSDQWSLTDVKVLLTAEDNLSSVEETFYSLNGSEFVKGTSLLVTTEGINKVKYYSIDGAGNKEETKSIQVKVDKTAPVITADINKEYMLGTEFGISYSIVEEHSGVDVEEVSLNGVLYQKGDAVPLDQPGVYTFTIKVTDHAGWTTTFEREFVVYIPVTLEVLPKVIKGNKGIFTVKANLLKEFVESAFEVSTATLNGVAPKLDNNGLTKQAEKGHFKFEREDFYWKTGRVELEFRAYLENGFLVVGKTIVDVK